jgi:hypothetical protein
MSVSWIVTRLKAIDFCVQVFAKEMQKAASKEDACSSNEIQGS